MKGPFGVLLVGGGLILMIGLFTGKITFPGAPGAQSSDFGGNQSNAWLPKGAKPTPTQCQPGYARDTFGICQKVAVGGKCTSPLVFDSKTGLCLPPTGSF